jgi:Ribonuclease G/E
LTCLLPSDPFDVFSSLWKVFQAVEQELRKDRAPSKVLQVFDFGLVIITRKRVKQSLERVLTEPCPYCAGSAVIKSSSTICYEILSEVKKISADLDGQSLVLRVNPDIARVLKDEERPSSRISNNRSAGRLPSAPMHNSITSSLT